MIKISSGAAVPATPALITVDLAALPTTSGSTALMVGLAAALVRVRREADGREIVAAVSGENSREWARQLADVIGEDIEERALEMHGRPMKVEHVHA
jgi:hypothetical protein